MPTYRTRPDGLNDVQLDDGQVLPMALTPEQLEAQGIMRAEATESAQNIQQGFQNQLAPGMQAPAPMTADPTATADATGTTIVMPGAITNPQPLPSNQPAPMLADVPGQPVFTGAIDPAAAPYDQKGDEIRRNLLAGGKPNIPDAAPGTLVSMPAAGVATGPGQQAAYNGARGGENSNAAAAYAESLMRPTYVAPREASDVRTGFSMQRAAPLTEEQRANSEALADKSVVAAEESAGATGRALDAATKTGDEIALNQAAALENERRRAVQKAADLDQLRTIRDERRAAIPTDIKQMRWGENAGGLPRLLALISVGLGGYAQGLNGGQNPGMVLFQQAVADDIAAQKEEIALAQNKGEEANNDYQKLLATYGDPKLVDRQLEIEGLDIMEKLAMGRLQSSQDDAQKAALEMQLADVREQRQKKQNEFDGRAGVVVEQYQHDPGRAGGYTRVDPLTAIERGARFAEAANKITGTGQKTSDQNRLALERQVIMPDRSIRYTARKEDADHVTTLAQNKARADQVMANMEKILAEPGAWADRGKVAQAKQLGIEAMRIAGSIVAPGEAQTEGEAEMYAKLVPMDTSSAGTFQSTMQAQIDGMRDMTNSRFANAIAGRVYADPDATRPLAGATQQSLKAPDAPWEK